MTEKREEGGVRCKAWCLPNRRGTPRRWTRGRADEPEVVSREYHDDVALALALVQAARSVEQVVDVSAGRYGTAVTYGPGQRVSGIVVRRPTPSAGSAAPSLVVEAHLVVATAAVTVLAAPPLAAQPLAAPVPTTPKTAREKGQRPQATSARGMPGVPRAPVLLRIADEARRVLDATLRRLRPNEQWVIDITIDDLRDTDAHDSSRVQ